MAFTYFFRDTFTLELVAEAVTSLLQSKNTVRIWDAGCAMGPEPYTLAIILAERLGLKNYKRIMFTATDLDPTNEFMPIIKKGSYPVDELNRVEPVILNKYFVQEDDPNCYQIVPFIKEQFDFFKHDLLTLTPPHTGFDVILCKNVLLHFSEPQRIEVMKMFWQSMNCGGYFASEHTQKMPAEVEPLFIHERSHAQFWRKPCK